MKYRIGVPIIIVIILFTIIIFKPTGRNSDVFDLYSELNDQSEVVFESEGGEEIKLEIAHSPAKRSRGLMFIEELDQNDGMLFVFEEEDFRSFHMLNTYISLDMIFLDSNFRVVTIHRNTKTLQTDETYQSTKPAKYVIEMNSGWVDENNIEIGDQFSLVSIDTE